VRDAKVIGSWMILSHDELCSVTFGENVACLSAVSNPVGRAPAVELPKLDLV
jgi:hypothetical protein